MKGKISCMIGAMKCHRTNFTTFLKESMKNGSFQEAA